jgi:hypothetical protein
MANFKVTLTQTTPDFTLKKKPAVSNVNVSRTSTPSNISQLEDTLTLEADKEDGAVLVYRKSSSRYELKKLLLWDDVLNNYKMDGGEF